MTKSEQEEDFGAMLEAHERAQPTPTRRNAVAVGDKVRGRVVSIGSDTVFVELVEFGSKSEATLDLDQVKNADGELMVDIGQELEARVVDMRGATAVLKTSMGRGRGRNAEQAAAELAQAFAHELPVEGTVSASIKGGVEVQVSGMRAFCPISQLDSRFVEDAESYVGQKLNFRIIRFETERRQPNIVLSRRALLDEEAKAKAAELREQLVQGAILTGTVTTLKPYGAFVDLGGLEGMIHVSELGFGRVDHPSEVVNEGQEVRVQVLRVEAAEGGRGGKRDKKTERIALSLKALAQDPWEEAANRFSGSDKMTTTGKIVRLQTYGAFVELMPGVEGLMHISKLGAGRRINHPSEVVRVGEEVEVEVLEVDHQRRRISLSRLNPVNADEASAEDVAAYRPRQPRGGSSGGGGFGTFADLLKKKR